MATATQTILATQIPWSVPADLDPNQPVTFRIISRGGVGQDGDLTNGGHGAGGGAWIERTFASIANASSWVIDFDNDGRIAVKDDQTFAFAATNGQNGVDGGLGGDWDSNSDYTSDTTHLGGRGGTKGTTGGGGGGEAGGPTNDGAVGVNGSTVNGGAGGTGGDGADGGAGGNALAIGVAGSNYGGAGGGGGSSGVGGAAGPAKVQAIYTVLAETATVTASAIGSDGRSFTLTEVLLTQSWSSRSVSNTNRFITVTRNGVAQNIAFTAIDAGASTRTGTLNCTLASPVYKNEVITYSQPVGATSDSNLNVTESVVSRALTNSSGQINSSTYAMLGMLQDGDYD